MASQPDGLTQDYLDTFLMTRLAAAGTLNPSKERDPAVVEHMIHMRERGDHPSVISSTSRLHNGGERSGAAVTTPRTTKYEPASAAWKSRYSPPRDDDDMQWQRHQTSPVRRSGYNTPPVHADDSASQAVGAVAAAPRRTPTPDLFETPTWARARAREEPPYSTSRERHATVDEDELAPVASFRRQRDSPASVQYQQKSPVAAVQLDAASRTSQLRLGALLAPTHLRGVDTDSNAGDGHKLAQRYCAPSKFASAVAQRLQELNGPTGDSASAIPPVAVTAPNVNADGRETYSRRSNRSNPLPQLRAPDAISWRKQRHDDDASRRSYTQREPQQRYDEDEERRQYERERDDGRRHDRRDRRSNASSAIKYRHEQERELRHELMIELDKHKIEFDQNAETWELKHLLERTLANNHLLARVAFVKQGLKLGAFALEWILDKFAPALRLKGWAETLSQTLDTGNHDVTLEQVYRKLWHKGPPNAWVNIGMLLVGSAVVHCIAARITEASAATGGSGNTGGALMGIISNIFGSFGGMAKPAKTTHKQHAPAKPATSSPPPSKPPKPFATTPTSSSPDAPARRSRLAPPT